MVPGWFFMVPGQSSWFFMVPGCFFMVPGRFSWFFIFPGGSSWFFMVPGWFQVGFSWFQVGFCVLMVTGRFSKKRVIHDKSKYRNKMAYVRASNFRPDNDSFR